MHRAAEPRHFQPAHPRSRGEHVPVIFALERVFGSSPLARGTSAGGLMMESRARLIPARAGNMVSTIATLKALAAHPRSRGEHLVQYAKNNFPAWLIPARAGNIATIGA